MLRKERAACVELRWLRSESGVAGTRVKQHSVCSCCLCCSSGPEHPFIPHGAIGSSQYCSPDIGLGKSSKTKAGFFGLLLEIGCVFAKLGYLTIDVLI